MTRHAGWANIAIMNGQFNEICTQLECWYQSRLGQYAYQQEKSLTESLLAPLHGHRLLQLGISSNSPLHTGSNLPQKIYATRQSADLTDLCTELDQLPFASESVDLMVLHHAIEFSPNSHQLLREANRVLAPRGDMIIVGFNPLSLFGLSTQFQGLLANRFWQGAMYVSNHRLKDWLRLLGLEVESVRHGLTLPPLGQGRVQACMLKCDQFLTRKNWPLGGFYIVHAHKHVSAITADRAQWNRRVGDRFIGLTRPKPIASPFERDAAA